MVVKEIRNEQVHHDGRLLGRRLSHLRLHQSGRPQVPIGDKHVRRTHDPLTGAGATQEGNGHQGEFSHDNQYILAADEDFKPVPPGSVRDHQRAGRGRVSSRCPVLGGGAAASFLPDLIFNGPVPYGGYGCDASDPIPPLCDLRAAAATAPSRGDHRRFSPAGLRAIPENPEAACFPGEKAENGINAGYDAVLLVNHHAGEAGGVFCGSGDFPASPPDRHRVHHPPGAAHDLWRAQRHDGAVSAGVTDRSAGRPGREREGRLGVRRVGLHAPVSRPTSTRPRRARWRRSTHTRSRRASTPTTRSAEATSPSTSSPPTRTRTSPTSSYYAGGMRVFTFGPGGLVEQGGRYIDEGGSNFWGVEVVATLSRVSGCSPARTATTACICSGTPGRTRCRRRRRRRRRLPRRRPPPAARCSQSPPVAGGRLRVGNRRYVRVPFSCPETVAGDCRGRLTLAAPPAGMRTLAQKWFVKDADTMSSVRVRIAKSQFRPVLVERPPAARRRRSADPRQRRPAAAGGAEDHAARTPPLRRNPAAGPPSRAARPVGSVVACSLR